MVYLWAIKFVSAHFIPAARKLIMYFYIKVDYTFLVFKSLKLRDIHYSLKPFEILIRIGFKK